MSKPKPLLADDVCRVCFHGPHEDRACFIIDPVEINPYGHVCGCDEYVNLEIESRIIVPALGAPS